MRHEVRLISFCSAPVSFRRRAHALGTGSVDRRPGRLGFTLLELMIVLSLLAFLVAIAWPTLRRPMLRSVTQQAARQLVRDLSRTRLNAIDTGRTMAIRYELGAARYCIVPADTLSSDSDELQGPADDVLDAPTGTDQPVPRQDLEIMAQLDEDVTFADPAAVAEEEIPADSALGIALRDEMRETEEVKPLVQDISEVEVDWSPPILVYPTGRADNAQFVLRGPDGYSVTVTLRGLTGAVKIGPLMHELRSTEDSDRDKLSSQDEPPLSPAAEPDLLRER